MESIQTSSIGTLIEPEPIGFSFSAPGWMMLMGFLILLVLMYAIFGYIKFKRNKYRRIAIGIIESLQTQELPVDQLIFRITETLKRVAVTSYNRSEVAHLYGSQWMAYLEQRNESGSIFTPRTREIISNVLYQGKRASLNEEDIQNFQNESLSWIKNHRV
jgi:hypothetical protein